MSYSTSTVIQCWQWKEVIKNRYNYRKGTKSTDPSFFCHNLCFYSSFKDTSFKASYVWIFFGFTTSLAFKHCSWWPGSSKNNYSKTNNLKFTQVHSEISNCHERDKQKGAVSDLRHIVRDPQVMTRTSGVSSLTFLCNEDQNWFPLLRICDSFKLVVQFKKNLISLAPHYVEIAIYHDTPTGSVCIFFLSFT